MTEKPSMEEKSPLLLYMVEQDENVSKNNKRMYFDKTRLHNLTSGASAVFTDFPNYVSTYWVASVLAALIFFMMVLLVVSTMSASVVYPRPTRCIREVSVIFDNKTIHLVHTEKDMNLQHVELLEEIMRHYPEYRIHLTLIHDTLENESNKEKVTILPKMSTKLHVFSETVTPIQVSQETVTFRRTLLTRPKEIRRKRTIINPEDMSINMGVKRLLDMLLHSRNVLSTNINEDKDSTSTCPLTTQTSQTARPTTVKTLADVINHAHVYLENTTYANAFAESPLQNTWQHLNDELRIFALRIVQLWQYGGISFSLEPTAEHSSMNFSVFARTKPPKNYKKMSLVSNANRDMGNNVAKENTGNSKLMRFIHGEKYNLEKLPFGVVTADDEGLHIVSKTRCHAFFEEVLVQLKRAKKEDTVKDIVQESLKVFCRHLSVDKKYCDMLMKRRG